MDASHNCIIVRYSEIGLKGRNRAFFERQLVTNILLICKTNFLGTTHLPKVDRVRGRILVKNHPSQMGGMIGNYLESHPTTTVVLNTSGIPECVPPRGPLLSSEKERYSRRIKPGEKSGELSSLQTIIPYLRNVFGIIGFSPAYEIEPSEIHAAIDTVLMHVPQSFSTFRVSVQRLDKHLEKTSNDWERELGAYVVQQHHKKVSLTKFDVEVCVEFFNNKAYVFLERFKGLGGLPVGVSGTVVTLIETITPQSLEYSLLAAWLMLKRGCKLVIAVQNGESFLILLIQKTLQPYYPFHLRIIPLVKTDELNTLPTQLHSHALVVAQTLSNITTFPVNSMVLRPLVGYTSDQIQNLIKSMNTK